MMNESVQMELNSRSVEELLDSLSLRLMHDNIYQQIHGELDSDRNFLDVVLNKFRFICENGDFDDSTKQTIQTEITDFCSKIIGYIVSVFDLAYNELPGEEQEVAETLYQFFVLKKASNTENFIISYIEENKVGIIDALGLEKGTDIISNASARKTNNPDNIKIVSNVDAVIRHIISMGISTEEFLEVLSASGEYHIQNLQEYVMEDAINGNFVTEYMTSVIDDYDSEFSTNIRNSIRVHFGMS